MKFMTFEELIKGCSAENKKIYELIQEQEAQEADVSVEEIREKVKINIETMRSTIKTGMVSTEKAISNWCGDDCEKLQERYASKRALFGKLFEKIITYSLSTIEENLRMGKIVACPTAGSCGILPAVILTTGHLLNKTDDELIQGLFAASAIGMIIGMNATFSGAEGGCQAECGSAAAMASGAVVELMGGTPKMSLDAAAIIFKNVLGLVCDPVAGLVEIPCAKRNVSGAINALCTADMVMAGVDSKIPFDDAVAAMYKVGTGLPEELRETALGGCAITPTGKALQEKVFGKKEN